MGRLIAWIAAGTIALGGVAFISAVVLAFLLPSDPPNEDVGNRIAERLRPHEQATTAPVDLTEVVDAEWSRALIVCRGADTADLNEALGFDWHASPMVESPGFESAVLFVHEDVVVRYFSSGQDDAFVHARYVTFCEPFGDLALDGPFIVPLRREHSVIEFTFMPDRTGSGLDYWYVSDAEQRRHIA